MKGDSFPTNLKGFFCPTAFLGKKDERHGCIEVVQVDPDAIDFALPADSTLSAPGDVDLSEFQVK